MENHPIPQDVTGFKFKLIGSITVKQFLYLLGFGILTVVSLMVPMAIFIKAPLMMLFSGIGVILAFIPIEGRPADVMIANFAKAIPSENRYIFRKKGVNLANYEVFKASAKKSSPQAIQTAVAATAKSATDDKRAILISRLRNSTFRPDDSEIKQLNNIKAFFDEDAKAPIRVIPIQQADAEPQESHAAPIQKTVTVQNVLNVDTEERPVVLIERTDEKTEALKKESAVQKPAEPSLVQIPQAQAQPSAETPPVQAEKTQIPEIKLSNDTHTERPELPVAKINQTPSPSLAGGFPTLPDVGNVVLGIVRDPRGKTLPNILVEVVDSNNIPVRAFKTNALGQFASATPLSDGTYKISFEDPQKQHDFQDINVTLTGEIFQPIEEVSIDAREKLRQELFGGQPAAPGVAG